MTLPKMTLQHFGRKNWQEISGCKKNESPPEGSFELKVSSIETTITAEKYVLPATS